MVRKPKAGQSGIVVLIGVAQALDWLVFERKLRSCNRVATVHFDLSIVRISRLKMLLQSLACKIVQRGVTVDYVKMGMSDF